MYRPSIGTVKAIRFVMELQKLYGVMEHVVEPFHIAPAQLERQATVDNPALQAIHGSRDLTREVSPTVKDEAVMAAPEQDQHLPDQPQGNQADSLIVTGNPDNQSPAPKDLKEGGDEFMNKIDELDEANEVAKGQEENSLKGDAPATDPARQIKEAREQKHEIDERAIREDAQLAADVIEQETVEVNQEISLQEAFAPAAEAKLMQEFGQKLQELEEKLDKNEERYFKKNPDLSQDERGAAEERFKEIRDQEVGALKDQQAERLAEHQKAQEANREELEKRRRELEGTRAER